MNEFLFKCSFWSKKATKNEKRTGRRNNFCIIEKNLEKKYQRISKILKVNGLGLFKLCSPQILHADATLK